LVTGRAAADGYVVTGVATCVRPANGPRRRRAAGARIGALVTVTGPTRRAVRVADAFPSSAGHQRIAEESFSAEADGPVVSGLVAAQFAIGVAAARIRTAQFAFIKGPAAFEWMSCVAFGAAADGLVVLHVAVGANSAHSGARIGTFQVETGLAHGALLVLRALGVAARERIALEVDRARTHGAVIHNAAVGVDAARSARIAAAEVDAGRAEAALSVAFAFVAAAIQRITEVTIQAGADDA